MRVEQARREDTSGFPDIGTPTTSGNPNVSRSREPVRLTSPLTGLHRLVSWSGSWPLTARVPIVAGALILGVAVLVSHVMLTTVVREQEVGMRRIAAVYLDGISTTIFPHVAVRNLANTDEALRRTMWFHQSMRERRAMVLLPDGTLFADVAAPDASMSDDDPLHRADLRARLTEGHDFTFDSKTGTGWARRVISRNGQHVADLYVALELKVLVREREALRDRLLVATVLSGLLAAAIGFLIVRRMVLPVRLLTERLRQAEVGSLDPVDPALLPPAGSEYGQLLRGYNGLVAALNEREVMAARLAEQERESVLGRLAATVAHEVRNPLGGMSTALDTVRKFGNDPQVRAKSLDLIERGLWSIRDVVGSVLAFHRLPTVRRPLVPEDLDDLRLLLTPEASRRKLGLNWWNEIEHALEVPATETRQIALNLLLNACEASPSGSTVGLHAWLRAKPGERQAELVLEVSDSGPGLPSDAAELLTVVSRRGAAEPRSGLGLSVVRELVRTLGGLITVEAGNGEHGSRIEVSLPVGPATVSRP